MNEEQAKLVVDLYHLYQILEHARSSDSDHTVQEIIALERAIQRALEMLKVRI